MTYSFVFRPSCCCGGLQTVSHTRWKFLSHTWGQWSPGPAEVGGFPWASVLVLSGCRRSKPRLGRGTSASIPLARTQSCGQTCCCRGRQIRSLVGWPRAGRESITEEEGKTDLGGGIRSHPETRSSLHFFFFPLSLSFIEII